MNIPEAIGQKSTTQWENISQREKEALALLSLSILLSYFSTNSELTWLVF